MGIRRAGSETKGAALTERRYYPRTARVSNACMGPARPLHQAGASRTGLVTRRLATAPYTPTGRASGRVTTRHDDRTGPGATEPSLCAAGHRPSPVAALRAAGPGGWSRISTSARRSGIRRGSQRPHPTSERLTAAIGHPVFGHRDGSTGYGRPLLGSSMRSSRAARQVLWAWPSKTVGGHRRRDVLRPPDAPSTRCGGTEIGRSVSDQGREEGR